MSIGVIAVLVTVAVVAVANVHDSGAQKTPAGGAPMVVDGPATQRSGTTVTHSVYCIPADTTPFDLGHADLAHVVGVTSEPYNLPQHSPCPSGPIIDTF
jgi:hypothetical protein